MKRRRRWIPACVLMFTPRCAEAHLVSTGLGPVYDRIGHLLLTPEDWVPLMALALFAGLHGAEKGRRVLFLLPAAWFAGGLVGMIAHKAPSLPVPAVALLILGALVAADVRLRLRDAGLLAVVFGATFGSRTARPTQPRWVAFWSWSA